MTDANAESRPLVVPFTNTWPACTFQSQPGHWSAFWITGPGVSKFGDDARDGCEIDIMEKPWLDELSLVGFKGTEAFGQRSQKIVSAVCGVVLLGFGLKFVWDAGVTIAG